MAFNSVVKAFYSFMGYVLRFFLVLWNLKRYTLTSFFALVLIMWLAVPRLTPPTYAVIVFQLSILVTALFLMFLLTGIFVVGGIEDGSISLENALRVIIGALIANAIVLAVLCYLGLMLMGIAPPPQSLAAITALLNAMEATPIVVLAITIPAVVGYFLLKDKWTRFRAKAPFWGSYLGIIASLLYLYPIMRYPQIWYFAGFQFFSMAGVTIVVSIFSLAYPREAALKACGLILPLIGFLSWFIAWGGMTLGSILCVLAGAILYSWRPREVKTFLTTKPSSTKPHT
jgi:hypothetical protein